MASIINASSTGSGGIVQTADASGVLQLQNNGNITVTFDASSNMGLGTASPSARLSVLLSNSTAYASTAPSASNCTAAFINTASHVSGGTFAGYQINISGDSQNRIGYIGAVSGSSSDQALSLVFGVNSGAGSRAEALRINSNANVILQGGTTTADGVGLTFPATQVASTNANTLDDYEEGTWTPNPQNNGSTSSFSSKVGYYRKVGSVVTCWFSCNSGSSNGGSGSGAVILNGLPFAMAVGNQIFFMGQVAATGVTNASGYDWISSAGGTSTGAQILYNAAGNQEQGSLTGVNGVFTYIAS
jgi:hypothetical protein